jgi:CRISPR-associated protein Cas1
VTAQATATLLAGEVDVVFLSSFGKFRGRLVYGGSKHALLRRRQLELMADGSFSLKLAKAIVEGKIQKQRVILQRQAGRVVLQAERPRFDRALTGMMQMRQGAMQAANVESLRGYEGKAAAYYFEALRIFLDPAWGFEKRAYYPPPDPFNALLSFAYSLLLKDVTAGINLVGLDLYVGFFHEIDYGRPSLALDLMEEWRPVVADALVLELVNRGTLTPDDFVWTGQVRRPVELKQGGVEQVLHGYGRRLETTGYHPLAGPGGQTTWQRAMVLQARRLARVIAGRESGYETFQIQ